MSPIPHSQTAPNTTSYVGGRTDLVSVGSESFFSGVQAESGMYCIRSGSEELRSGKARAVQLLLVFYRLRFSCLSSKRVR
jgi:hypothetical protein